MSFIRFLALSLVMLGAPGPIIHAQEGPASLDELLEQVRESSRRGARQNQERERRFLESRDQQRALLDDAQNLLEREQSRGDQLRRSFDDNEKALTELEEDLRVRIGNFGELFGIVRQVAGDTKGILDSSLVSAQYPARSQLAARLAQARGLPSMDDLQALRLLLLEEMAESGKVVRFSTTLTEPDGTSAPGEVIRVGVFNSIAGDRFLQFQEETGTLQVLGRQPPSRYRSMAAGVSQATEGILPMAVDPSRGQLLGLLIQSPSLMERVSEGRAVGYVIIAMGVFGVLISIWRLIVLRSAGSGIRRQLRDTEKGRDDNPLGRIIQVYERNQGADTDTLELKLDEAILREVPLLERYQGTIKVFAAVAPLLGLLGTVVGMIVTFQALTLFGTGDPKLMAGGISQALVTTVLGLLVAIPLVLLHSVVAGWSRSLIEVLEEQSAGIIARHAEN